MTNITQIISDLQNALLVESAKHVEVYDNSGVKHKHNCSIVGCKRMAISKKLCNTHYLRRRKGINELLPIKNRKSGTLCTICSKPLKGKGGWRKCSKHYKMTRQKIIKRVLVNLFGNKCSECGHRFPLNAYDFHHLGNKEKSIASLIGNSSPRKIAVEIIKCVLICANCHRIKHGETNGY